MASFQELYQRERELAAQGKELSNSKKYAKVYNQLHNHPLWSVVDSIRNQVIELDRQLDQLGALGLTDEEKEAFLQKAIEQVQPYYDRKTKEIETGIAEGKLRTAEDILLYTRDVENEVRTELESLDLRTAETEEEFLNKIADITSTRDENLDLKREEWRRRLEDVKLTQIRSGIFSSGIGIKKRREEEAAKTMEEGILQQRAQRDVTQAETARKYEIEQIRLAREAAERDRAARIGAPATEQALETTGYEDLSKLPSRTEIEAARAGDTRNVSIYKPEALSSLEEERLKAVESRKMELQSEELTLREKEYEEQRKKILSAQEAKKKQLAGYGVSY